MLALLVCVEHADVAYAMTCTAYGIGVPRFPLARLDERTLLYAAVAASLAQGLLLAGFLWRRHARERANDESRQWYASVADMLDERVATLSRDGTIVSTNRAWREFAQQHGGAGVDAGHNYVQCVQRAIERGQKDAERTLESLRSVLWGGEPTRRLEYFSPGGNGDHWRYEMRIVALQRKEGGALVTVQDITDRWQSEERLRVALESLPFATFFLDGLGTIELVNREAEQLFGYTRSELLGRMFSNVVPEFTPYADDHERTVTGIRSDGGEIPVQAFVRPIAMASRTMLLVSLTDLSERRRLAAEVHRLREETAHFGRVAAIGELSAAIAHELNQPLAGIMMNCQAAQRLLESSSYTIDDVVETFGDIAADARRAGEVIQRLRLMLRKAPADIRPLDLNDVVKQVQRLVAHDLALKGSALDLELAEELPAVSADRVHLQQVVLNLVLNGADAMAGLPIEARRMVLRTRPGIRHTVELELRDSGPGIAPTAMTHVFDPFFTTKPNGMGMGLSIVRSIIESHGGRITCANAASGGAVFHVTLPSQGGMR